MRALLLISAFAGVAGAAAPQIPQPLRPPADQVLAFELRADGVQVYECAADRGTYAWRYRAPIATLADAQGRSVGRQHESEAWEANDGSRIAGEMRAQVSAGNPASMPQRMWTTASTSGSGMLAPVRTVVALDSDGGEVPMQLCDASHAGDVANVPYSAGYFFYVDSADAPPRAPRQGGLWSISAPVVPMHGIYTQVR